ncbi:MAG: TetR/AcrR family transcriptional regulator [Trueperaceae bacterium]
MPKMIDEQRILQATLETISTHGYDGATTRLIAEKAAINELTLFRKFGSKTNLILRAVKQELEAFKEAKLEYTGNLEDDLERIVTFYQSLFETRGKVIPVILSEFSRRGELREGLQDLMVSLKSLALILTRYQKEGKLMKEPPMTTLSALLSPIIFMNVIGQFDSSITNKFNKREYVTAFLTGRKVAKKR